MIGFSVALGPASYQHNCRISIAELPGAVAHISIVIVHVVAAQRCSQ